MSVLWRKKEEKSLHKKTALLHNVLEESGDRNRVVLILLRCQRERQERSHGPEEDPDHPDHGWEEQAGECLSAEPYTSMSVCLSVWMTNLDFKLQNVVTPNSNGWKNKVLKFYTILNIIIKYLWEKSERHKKNANEECKTRPKKKTT